MDVSGTRPASPQRADARYCRAVSTEPLRCAGALIVDHDGRIFFQRRSPATTPFPNCWDIVGGHLEPGEDIDEALRREITEETGWVLSHVLGQVGEYRYVGDDGLARIENDFLVRVDGDLDRPEAGGRQAHRVPLAGRARGDGARRAPRRQRRADPADRGGGLRRPAVDRSVNTVELAPHRFAGLVAPAVDRAFRAGMLAGRDGGGAELSQRYGGPAATGFLVELRTRLAAPGGTVDGPGSRRSPATGTRPSCRRTVDKQVAYGMIHRGPDGALLRHRTGRRLPHRAVPGARRGHRGAVGRARRPGGPAGGGARPAAGVRAGAGRRGRRTGRLGLRRDGARRTSRTAPRRACCCSTGSARCATTGPTRTPPRGPPPGTPRRASPPCRPGRSGSPSSWRPTGGPPARTPRSAPEERLTMLADLAALPG